MLISLKLYHSSSIKKGSYIYYQLNFFTIGYQYSWLAQNNQVENSTCESPCQVKPYFATMQHSCVIPLIIRSLFYLSMSNILSPQALYDHLICVCGRHCYTPLCVCVCVWLPANRARLTFVLKCPRPLLPLSGSS